MANALNGVKVDILAQKSIENFKEALMPVAGLSTDLSPEPAQKGDTVDSRIYTLQTAYDFAGDYSSNSDSASTKKSVTLDQHKYRSVRLSDVENTKFGVRRLMDELSGEAAYAVGLAVSDYVMSQILEASFTNEVVIGAPAAFDSDDVVDIKAAADVLKWTKGNRSMVLGPTYDNALLKDSSVKDASAVGAGTPLITGNVPQLAGFNLLQVTDVPNNSEDMVGFACVPAGGLLAVRVVDPQVMDGEIISHAVAVDERTGVAMGVRKWYDVKSGEMYITWECLFGWAAGNGDGIIRLVSA